MQRHKSGFFFPFLITLTCHALLAWLLWYGWHQSTQIHKQRQPVMQIGELITANTVTHDPIEALRQKQAAEKARQAAELAQKKQAEKAKQELLAKQALIRKQQEELKQKQLAEKRAEEKKQRELAQKAAEEAKRQAELKKQAELAKQAKLREQALLKAEQAKKKEAQEKEAQAQKEELDRRQAQLAAAQQQKEALAKAEAEKKRQATLDAEKRAFEAALESEEQFLGELEDQAKLGSMQALIKTYVEQKWSRPPSAKSGMQALLKITLLSTGEVAGVRVMQSSGNSSFDRSAEQAVHKAGPFRELMDLKPHQREAFREFNMLFKPEDI